MRPWYYSHVFADPRDADTVYVFNVKAWRSTDGGRTFSHITMPHTDTHDLWIDPRDTSRMVAGNDGGGCVTFNGGETWSTVFNQPTGQYYYMTADDQFPYRVYGTQQDGTAVSVASSVVHGRDHPGRLVRRRRLGERTRRREAGRPEHRLLRGDRQLVGPWRLAAALRPPHGTGAHRVGLAGADGRLGAQGPQVQVPVELPDRLLAPRSERAVRGRQRRLPQRRRGPDVADDQPGPDPGGRVEDGAVGRPDLQRDDLQRALRDDLLVCRVAARARRALGGLGRRSAPPLARRRRHVGERHARRAPRPYSHRHDRAVPPRP